MNIVLILIAIIGGAVGILTTIYGTISIPVVIIWKLHRKIKYHISMFD
jgi:hypothetical protein